MTTFLSVNTGYSMHSLCKDEKKRQTVRSHSELELCDPKRLKGKVGGEKSCGKSHET